MPASYSATPEPCSTMNTVVMTNMETHPGLPDNMISLQVYLPAVYTEILQERVNEDDKLGLSCAWLS